MTYLILGQLDAQNCVLVSLNQNQSDKNDWIFVGLKAEMSRLIWIELNSLTWINLLKLTSCEIFVIFIVDLGFMTFHCHAMEKCLVQ